MNQESVTPALGETPRLAGRKRLLAGTLAGLAAWCLSGCGYQAVYGSSQGPRYEVVAGRVATSSFEVVQAAMAGVRSELGPGGALGSGYPRVVVEIVRIDERSIGVRSAGNALPLARGSEVVVVGRAHVLERPDAAPSRDTGDLSRAAEFAAGTTPSADAASRSRALRDAARSLGKALGRAVLGLPEPAEG
ncbi:MAG TPA: hypothetical protein VHP33_16445 [Polyangiaceae bacterium]|nr:hypothetical protein [Polyangiaceae bacterium]